MSRAIIVVPCYNEAKRLNLRVIQDFARRTAGVELLLVDDGSKDETPELIEHLHRNNPQQFTFLRLQANGGKAEAVRRGVLAALGRGADYVGFWDADLATPLAEIPNFIRVLDERPRIELVVGTRMRLLGRRIERRPLRRVLGRVFATTASLALGIRIFDTQCGAKLFRATERAVRLFEQPFMTRWIFDVELLARMKSTQDSRPLPLEEIIYEHPLDEWRDVAGSSVRSADFVKASVEMARIYWTYLRPGASRWQSSLPPHGPLAPATERSQRAA
jgi:dolichyl-phosphate beta-glucosyltransferase